MRVYPALVVLSGCGFAVPAAGGSAGDDTPGPDTRPSLDAAVPADVQAITCAPGYAGDFGGSKYRFATEQTKLDYDAAAAGCAADGGRLAVIESLAEHDHIALLVRGYSDWSWIGLTDRLTEGTRVWITGPTLQPSDFQVFNGELNDPAADCYNLSPNPIGADSARWGNYYCTSPKGWICECDYTP